MARKTSINIKPCNIGNSEAHNRRLVQYLARILKEKFYIRTDLMAKNEAWVAPELGKNSLTDRYNQIAAMVKEKTGRAMQTKERIRVNKKTGGVTVVRGCTPLKEGVVVIKEDTKMEQLQRFCEVCKQRWGITALQVFIHRDEGHYGIPGDNATWTPNFHAHIVWDWMNHETGKSCKLGKEDMSEMQTLLAECLEMERGSSKEITGKKHLERDDFIIAKQKQEAERAKAEKEAAIADRKKAEAEREKTVEAIDKAKSKIERLDEETRIKERISSELDGEIADKEKQLKDGRKAKMDSILDSVGSIVGVGKSAAVEKENAKLKAENERIRKAFPDAVKNKVEELTKKLTAEKQEAEAGRQVLIKERDEAVRLLNEQKTDEHKRIEGAVCEATEKQTEIIGTLNRELRWKSALLDTLADLLYRAGGVFCRAIAAIIDFATSKYKSIFSPDEAADIKQVMRSYGGEDTELQKAVGRWLVGYAESREQLDEIELKHARKEVSDIAEGAYDWKIEKEQQEMQR